MSKKKIYIWCCDKNENTGEGILANKFIEDIKFYNKNIKLIVKKLIYFPSIRLTYRIILWIFHNQF